MLQRQTMTIVRPSAALLSAVLLLLCARQGRASIIHRGTFGGTARSLTGATLAERPARLGFVEVDHGGGRKVLSVGSLAVLQPDSSRRPASGWPAHVELPIVSANRDANGHGSVVAEGLDGKRFSHVAVTFGPDGVRLYQFNAADSAAFLASAPQGAKPAWVAGRGLAEGQSVHFFEGAPVSEALAAEPGRH